MASEAFDINEPAWDPGRDSTNERVSLLRELDATRVSHSSQLLDPEFRTVDGQPLGHRRAQLLLGCTFNDLESLVNRVNATSGFDDHDEVAELTSAVEELGQVVGRHRLLKRDSDEEVLERMSVGNRRQARLLQLRIDRLRLQRYDPVAIRQRELTAAVPGLTERLERALAEGDETEAGRLQHLLRSAKSDLERLRQ